MRVRLCVADKCQRSDLVLYMSFRNDPLVTTLFGKGLDLLKFFKWFLGLRLCGSLILIGIELGGITCGVAVVSGIASSPLCIIAGIFRRFPLRILLKSHYLAQYYKGSCSRLDCLHLYFIGTIIHRRGLGKKLLKAVEKTAKRIGYSCVCLESLSNSWVSCWYFREGYKPSESFRVGRRTLIRFVKYLGS